MYVHILYADIHGCVIVPRSPESFRSIQQAPFDGSIEVDVLYSKALGCFTLYICRDQKGILSLIRHMRPEWNSTEEGCNVLQPYRG